MRWKIAVSALALAGVAMIGAVFALRGRRAGPEKGCPVHRRGSGTDQGRAAQRPDGHDVQRRRRHSAQRQRQAGLGQSRQFRGAAGRSERAGVRSTILRRLRDQAKPPASAADATALAATINTPLVAPAGRSAAAGDDVGIPRPETRAHDLAQAGRNADRRRQLRSINRQATRSLQLRRRTAEQAGGSADQTSAPKTTSDATGVAQPSTPKIELPTKLSPQVVGARGGRQNRHDRARATAQTPEANRSDAGCTGKAGQGREEAEARASRRRDRDDWSDRAASRRDGRDHFGRMVRSARRAQVGGGSQERDSHGSAANTAPNSTAPSIGVHKAVVNGETIYRLRVVGLTKADAAAMCAG